MSAILDIVASMAVRGTIVLVMLNLVLTLNTALYDRTAQANTRQNLGATANVIYQDVKYAGYRTGDGIMISNNRELKMKGDLDDNGSIDGDEQIRYYGSRDETTKLWKLYRVYKSGTPLMVASDLQDFSFEYYDDLERSTNDKEKVKSIEVTLVGTVSGISTTETSTTKVFKVFPMNL